MIKKSPNKNLDIFIYGVKAFTPLVDNPVYKVLVHSDDMPSKFHTNLEIYRDFEGDNITDKNLLYNEYTGWYWVWQNWELKDYIGFNHYRRYFDCLNDLPNINDVFKKYRIVLNRRFPLKYREEEKSNREFYKIWHNVEDFDLMGDIVKELYPEYADGWDMMAESSYIYPSSIFIMKRNTFDEYMNFIFDVTEEFCDRRNCHTSEDFIKYIEDNKDKYIRQEHAYYDVNMQARVIGYLIERCLCAFLMSGGKKSLQNHALELPWHVFRVKYNE